METFPVKNNISKTFPKSIYIDFRLNIFLPD
jgi:hypothetical protein